MAPRTIASELRRLADYVDGRRHASRWDYVDHLSVLLTVSRELQALSAAAEDGKADDLDA